MGLTADLLRAVEGSGVEGSRKEVAVSFLTLAAPVVDGLGAGAFEALMRGLAGGADGVADVVAGQLDQGQALLLLERIDARMGELAAAHGEVLAARREGLEALKNVALMLVARVVLSAL